MSKLWKDIENWTSHYLAGQGRRGPTGRDQSDILHDTLAVEVKVRKELPAWLLGAMQQSVDNAEAGKLPIVVLHQAGEKRKNALVIIRIVDFKRFDL